MLEFNPFDPDFRENPYPTYAELRRNGPVYRHEMLGFCLVSGYDDVVNVLKQPKLFSSRSIDLSIDGQPTKTVINADPPHHTDLRNLVNRAFTPRMVADLEPRIRQITSDLLDAVVEKGEAELVGDLAVPLPVTIIAELLGVDPERRDDFKRWSNAFVTGDSMDVEENRQARLDIFHEARMYFEDVIADRRRAPRDDLISKLVRVSGEEEADLLTPNDLLAFISLLLVAGNETTTNLIGNAVLALLDHPGEMARVRDDPSLLPNLVEEALRYDSPVQFLFRTATEDTDIDGFPIPEGAGVIPLYASANRDERRFPDPDRFDITRNTQGHVAFGHGVHFCLGAPLARLEGKVALEQVLLRLPGLERGPGPVQRLFGSPFLRGLAALPVGFTPTPASKAAR